MASLTDTLTPRRAVSEVWFWYVRAGAAALVLGGAFGAGVLLGGDGDEDDEASAAGAGASALAVADGRTEKLEEIRAQLKLRFHDELVGPPRDAKDRPKAAELAEPREEAAKKPEAKPEPKDPVVEAAREKALADQASPPERREEDESVKAEDADEDVESIAVPRDDKARDQRRIAEALARVLGDDTPAWAKKGDGEAPSEEAQAERTPAAAVKAEPAKAEAPKREPATAAPATRYHLQVAATPSEDGARALAAKLEGQGFAALVVPVDLEGRGRVFRVRVGPFTDRAKAEARGAEVRAAAGLNGFVVTE